MENYINMKINIEQGGINITIGEIRAPRSLFEIDDDDTNANNIRVELGIAKVFHKVLNLIKIERELFQKEDFELLGEMLSRILFGRNNNSDDGRFFPLRTVEDSLDLKNNKSNTVCRVFLEFDQKSGVAMLPWEYILYKTRNPDVAKSIYLSANLKSRFHLIRRVKENSYERLFSDKLFIIVLVNVDGNGDVVPKIDSRNLELNKIKNTFKNLQDKFPDSLVVKYIESISFNKIKQEVEKIYSNWQVEYQQTPSYVIHYIGHSMLDEQIGKLVLLSAETGRPDWVKDRNFAAIFSEEVLNVEQPCMVCFQSCDSAKIGNFNGILRGVAYEFTKINIPAVIGMQNEINTDYSCAFFDRFYENVLNAKDVAEAITAGRDYLGREYNETDAYVNNSFGSPVLFITTKEPIQIIQPVAELQKMSISDESKPEMNINFRSASMMDRIGSQSNVIENKPATNPTPYIDDNLSRSVNQGQSDNNPTTGTQRIIDPKDTSSPNIQPKNTDE